MCCKNNVGILFSATLYVTPSFICSIRVSQKAPTAASRGALTFAALIVLRRSIALGSTALSISSSSASSSSSSSSSSTSSLLTEAVVPECVALLLSFLTSVSHNGGSGSGSGSGSAEHAEKCVEALMRAALLGEAPSGGRNGAGTGTFMCRRWSQMGSQSQIWSEMAVHSITSQTTTATSICQITTAQKKLFSGR
jgi:hypothetical protein